MKYILSIDQSTAGTKGIVFSDRGQIVSKAYLPHRQIVNSDGWIEHDPIEIYENTLKVAEMALEKTVCCKTDVCAVGISNQRETVVCWDRHTGEPIYNAIVWQCGRAKDIAQRLDAHAELIRSVTGLQLSPFFSAAKFAWIVENVPAAKQLADDNRLCCGNIDAWLVYKLTKEKAFKTDASNASRTQLLNLNTLSWDEKIVELFGLDIKMLPEICDSNSTFGHTDFCGLLPKEVPICAVLGDSQSALYANGCHTPFTAKATFGTGTSVMMNVGPARPTNTTNGVVESIAWGIDGRFDYVLEGNINYSGAIIKWLVDDVKLLTRSAESGEFASKVDSTGGVYLVPAFSGLGAPYWRTDVKAALCGMTAATKKEHIVRAAEEAIAYQIKDIFEELNSCCSEPLKELCVDGGATRDKFLMGFVADMLAAEIKVSAVEELSAAGVAYLASITSGCTDVAGIFDSVKHGRVMPQMSDEKREELYKGWKEAVYSIMK